MGNRTAQLRDLQALEVLASQLNDQRRLAKVDMLFAHYHISVGDYSDVVRRSEHVVELSRIFEEEDIVLDTYRVWPLALLRQGKLEEAMEVAHTGRQLAQLYGGAIKEGYILNSMGLIAIEQKDPAIAHGYLEQALSIAMEEGDRRLESITLGNLGNSAGYVRQDYSSAREYYEKANALMHERGEHSSECVTLGNLGWVAGMQGDFKAARSYQQQALQLSREVGNLYLETYTLINLSAAAAVTSTAQESLSHAQDALKLSIKAGDRSGEAWSLLYMGYAYLLLEALQQAEESFRRSVAIRDELRQPGMKIKSLAGLIQTLLKKEETASAISETEGIISYLDAGGNLEGTEEPLRVYYACYLVLEKAKDPRSSRMLLSAAQLLETQVSMLKDERSRQMYIENVPWRLAIQQLYREKSSEFMDNAR